MVDSLLEAIRGYYPQAMVLTDRSVLLADVLLQGETSLAGKGSSILVNPGNLPAGTAQKEPNSLVVVPALVDLFSRCGEPGFEARETLTSLQNCAQGGGLHKWHCCPTKRSIVWRRWIISTITCPLPFCCGVLFLRRNSCVSTGIWGRKWW
ncbi:MAG: hypothetical protein ACK421_08340, partial [Pseudanabaenaceae cyanobacterium]